jgi:hypothetical protein
MSSAARQIHVSAVVAVGRSLIPRSMACSVSSTLNNTKSVARFFSSRGGFRRLSSGKGPRGKGVSAKLPRLKNSSSNDVEVGAWYTTMQSRPKSLDMGRYGLKRLDYATLVPPVWTLPPQPPIKKFSEKIIFPLTLLFVAGIATWVYLNPEEEDMRDYWKRVETGQILLEDDDEDDEDWDEEEEED